MRVYPELTVDGEFQALGDLGHTGALNDRQFTFLRSRGFTNSLTDMFGQYRSWTPTQLFTTEGSRGFFYDFSDYTTQFTDTAGTTPVTSTGQSLGLVLDESQGLALGPELVTNGDFSGGLTGWAVSGTASVVSGQAQMAGNTTASGRITATITSLVVGRTYRVSCEQASITGAGVGRVYISTTASIGTAISTVNLVNGINSHVFVATATTHFLLIDTSSVSPSIVLTVDNISVRELPGNHATQATAGSRPLTTTIGTGYRGVQFDGVDDFLQTAAIDFSNSDKMTVVAGVRKLSDAATGQLVGTRGASVTNVFEVLAPSSTPNSFYFASGGSIYALIAEGIAAAPVSRVLTGLGDISGDRSTLRLNGVQAAQNTGDQGTGNYASNIVYIGRRAGTSLPFNGILTFLCVINRTLTAAELAQLEAFANSRTGAY